MDSEPEIVAAIFGALAGGLVSFLAAVYAEWKRDAAQRRADQLARLERIIELTDAVTRHLAFVEKGDADGAIKRLDSASVPQLAFFVSAYLPEAGDNCSQLVNAYNTRHEAVDERGETIRLCAWEIDKKAARRASKLVI